MLTVAPPPSHLRPAWPSPRQSDLPRPRLAVSSCTPSLLALVHTLLQLLARRHLIELRRACYNVELSAPLDNISFSTSSERVRIEENTFRNKLTFYAAAEVSSSFPPPDLPENAFAGRSNVVNALPGQWVLYENQTSQASLRRFIFLQRSKLSLVDMPLLMQKRTLRMPGRNLQWSIANVNILS